MEVLVGLESDIGTTRDINQDAMCIYSASITGGKAIMAAVCDGMGGFQEGEYASHSLVERLEKWFKTKLPEFVQKEDCIQSIKDSLVKELSEHNRYLIDYGDKKGISVGTTASVLCIIFNKYCIVHVGDSRIYSLDSKGITQLTEDHSKVMQEVRLGIITEKQAKKDPRRNRLTQCVGVRGEIKPFISDGVLIPMQEFLLCSDGFVHEITDEFIWKQLRPDKCDSNGVLREKVLKLIDKNKKRHETDNITALALKITV